MDPAHLASLARYLRSEALHLAVVPDFLARKDSLLSKAATEPMQFQANAQHGFQLGKTKPEIDLKPSAQSSIRVNASPGSNVFESNPFRAPAQVPVHTGYVSVELQGSLDLGVSGSEGDLTFGLDAFATVALEYLKAFPLGAGEPTLGSALGQTLSSFVIPADIPDLAALGINDIATASGQGNLKVSGAFTVTAAPNPLASASLPLGSGTVAVKAGAVAGLSASFSLSGCYQIRARRKDADTVELSFFRQRGSQLNADFSASAGITANFGNKDLITALLGAVSTDPTGDQKLLADLRPDEAQTLADAIRNGLDHTFQASLNLALSALTDDQAAFQYEIQPTRLSPESTLAVHKALAGDLSQLTAMERGVQSGGPLAPGVTLLNSVLRETRRRGITLKINLLGIVNFITMSELVRHGEALTDNVTGDLTIQETVSGTSLSAVVDPLLRHEALRKAIFDSVLVTTSYRAGKAMALPDLNCEQVHFGLNQNTNQQIMSDYLDWLVALDLLTRQDKASILTGFTDGGPSTCVLRTTFSEANCVSMFFDAGGDLRPKQYYLEIGRQALRALLDPEHQAIDGYRFRIVDDALWPTALRTGANVNLGPLAGLATADPRVQYLIGDVMVITKWAETMCAAGKAVQDVRSFVGDSDLTTLFHNAEFQKRRAALQQKLADLVKASKVRFDEPWGMVCLFWASGSPGTAYARIVTARLTLARGAQPVLEAAAA